jgi:hypothetical protein
MRFEAGVVVCVLVWYWCVMLQSMLVGGVMYSVMQERRYVTWYGAGVAYRRV